MVALSEATDLNNPRPPRTVATYTDIVNDIQGYVGIDAGGNGANEFYYSNWELGARSKNQFYERLKWLAGEAGLETLYGLSGECSAASPTRSPSTPRPGHSLQFELVTWSGGTGQMLAINSPTAATKLWIQLLTGVAPTDNQTLTGRLDRDLPGQCHRDARPVSTPFVGVSTGTAIIGAYGLGVGADDLAAADKVFDLTNTQITPPNNVTFTVGGLAVGEDRILVGPGAGGLLDEDQFTLQAVLTTDNVLAIVIALGLSRPIRRPPAPFACATTTACSGVWNMRPGPALRSRFRRRTATRILRASTRRPATSCSSPTSTSWPVRPRSRSPAFIS